MKKVLLTGAQGFIGRHCVPLLLDQGFEVHGVSSRRMEIEGVHMHQLDLLELKGVETLMHQVQPTHLLHLAWVTAPGLFWTSPDNPKWVEASLYLARHFQKSGGQRAVFAGTCAEYDWSSGTCSEAETPLNPATLYGQSKNELFRALQSLDLNMAWGRIFFLYGPHESPKKFIASLIGSLFKGEIGRCSHGNQIRDFLHVQDVARAFVALLDHPLEGALNIASGSPMTLKSICLKIAEKMKANDRLEIKELDSDAPPILTAHVKRLYDELNWKPEFDIDAGLEQTIQWWKENLQ